ncbi:AEC family transporter [Parvularcula sp. LCG005]|uniref:AEC family transporter n=1 Tax=Parvularcula sp. LCG005 TaxID=3078805 RepID=UPI00294236E1|nr:AEC family transporter [Parvularcula sp. LCG005]WOI53798.1 AEC family transporter [Parvularcula sp. LCG005]
MLEILLVVLPVFMLVGLGYGGTRWGVFKIETSEGMMAFAMKLAVPTLLFRAMMQLDLATVFEANLLLSFYIGAFISFLLATFGARLVIGREAPDSVVIGFGALFSNCFLLGIPIMERAFGASSLAPNFAIIAVHSTFCYLVGITAMELVSQTGKGMGGAVAAILRTMLKNTLMLGIAAGLLVNLSGLTLPEPIMQVVDMLANASLPVALFAMGGVLTRYEMRRSLGAASMVAGLSLMAHPAITLLLGTTVFPLSDEFLRSAVLTAAMPTGVNAYVFAAIYGRALGAAASAVLLATAASIATISFWLFVLHRLT